MPGTIHVEPRGPVTVVTLANPPKRNALDPAMCAELAAAFAGLAATGARAAVLTGDPGGKAFCAGFDLEALAGAPADAGDTVFDAAIDALSRCPVPVVAALGGAAMGGGCELAASCDLRVAHATVKLGVPPARLGIVYPPRGLARLSALVGDSRARLLFLTARTIDATQAHAWGLVDELTAEAEVLPRALALAEEIAALAPQAVQGMRLGFEALLRRRAALEGADAEEIGRRRAQAWASADAAEGRAAAAARRTPVFTGR